MLLSFERAAPFFSIIGSAKNLHAVGTGTSWGQASCVLVTELAHAVVVWGLARFFNIKGSAKNLHAASTERMKQ